MTEIYFYILTLIMGFITCFLFYEILTPGRGSRLAAWAEGAVGITVCSLFLRPMIQSLPLWIYTAVLTIIMAGILLLLYRVEVKKAVFWSVISCLIQIVTEFAALGLLFCIRRINFEALHAMDELNVTGKLFACIIQMFFIMFIIVLWKFRVQGMRRKNILLLIAIPLYQLVLLGCMFYMCSDFSSEILRAGLVIILFSLLLDWLTVGLINGQNQQAEMEEQVARLYEERKKELDYCAQNIRYLKEVRLMKHDFINMLQIADYLYDNDGSQEQIRELLELLKSRVNGTEAVEQEKLLSCLQGKESK